MEQRIEEHVPHSNVRGFPERLLSSVLMKRPRPSHLPETPTYHTCTTLRSSTSFSWRANEGWSPVKCRSHGSKTFFFLNKNHVGVEHLFLMCVKSSNSGEKLCRCLDFFLKNALVFVTRLKHAMFYCLYYSRSNIHMYVHTLFCHRTKFSKMAKKIIIGRQHSIGNIPF